LAKFKTGGRNILIATDEIGLCEYDVPVVADIIATDLTGFKTVPDRCQQGMLLAFTAMRLFKEGNFAKDPNMIFNGKTILSDKSQYFYNGNSQGGILGGVYMAVSTDVTRGVLGVGGGPYSLLLPRSEDFIEFFDVIKLRYSDPLDRMGLLQTIQLLWDRAEPSGYMNFLTNRTLPNTPAHHVIMQHGLGDAQVTYLGAYSLMRSAFAVTYESNVNEPNEKLYGFPYLKDSDIATDAALVTWDFPGIPPVPEENIPPPVNDTHEYVRRQNTSQAMMYNFFATGQIKNTCGGPCHGYIP